jgi:hypothetical protein
MVLNKLSSPDFTAAFLRLKKLYLKIQHVPRSKHAPSRLHKPVKALIQIFYNYLITVHLSYVFRSLMRVITSNYPLRLLPNTWILIDDGAN